MTLLRPEACLEHLLPPHVPQTSSPWCSCQVWQHPHGTGMFLWTWICCFCPVGPTWSPGKGVKSTRTCSPVGAIIPKRPGAFWEELRNSSSFPQEAEPSHSQCPGLFAGACLEQREAAPSLGMIWEGRSRLGSAAPSASTSLGKCTNAPSIRKAKKGEDL